jgi:general transcription factor 3C polypeptide 3 (transcription factor C subunit 4)
MDLTPRSRSQRKRRPPKQYEGALSWEQARDRDAESMQVDEDESEANAEGEEQQEQDNDAEGGLDVSSQDDISMSNGDEGSTSDEFVPDEDTRLNQSRKRGRGSTGRKGLQRQDEFGSDSGEEFNLSQQSDEAGSDVGDDQLIDSQRSLGQSQQQHSELTTSQRLDRAKKRMWVPPPGHGGLENPDAWREAGQRNRQMQSQGDASVQQEADVEVEGDQLQTLADAFTGDGVEATTAQVERWQTALHHGEEEQDEEELDEVAFEQDLRGAAGFKQRKIRSQGGDGGVVRRAPREQALAAPVKALLSEANFAFIDADLPKTIAKLQEVIKLEPAVRSAWATLALCFDELKEPQRAMQSRIMEAHLTYQPIGLWVELANASREMEYYEQALYCLSKAITSSREKDRIDVIDIMWERCTLLEEINEPKRAAQSYLQMLHYRPQNQSIIRRLIPLLFGLNMLDRAILILQKCEEWNMEAFPDPLLDPAMMDENVGPDVRYTYESSEVVTLADLLLRAGRPQEALDTIRRGARWLDGRGSEEYWDDVVSDDREFDESRDESDREGNYGRRVELAPVHYLDPEFRFQMAVARARLGNYKEAKRHFTIWSRDANVNEQLDHYSEMAEEYVRIGSLEEEKDSWYQEALDITTSVLNERQNNQSNDDVEAVISDYKRMAACYMGINEIDIAITWFQEVLNNNPDDFEVKLRLAEAYEDKGDRDTAIELVTQVVRSKRERQIEGEKAETSAPIATDETLTQSLSFFAEISQRATRDIAAGMGGPGSRGGDGAASRQAMREQRKELERIRELETSLAWKRIKSRDEAVFIPNWWSSHVEFNGDSRKKRYGDQETSQAKEKRYHQVSEWLSDVERLVNMFQNTTQLYPRNRTKKFKGVLRTKKKKADLVDSQANAILARLGDDLLEEGQGRDTYEHSSFRGIKLDDWVDLIMQYAFVLTKVGEFDTAYEVLNRVKKSSVIWTDEERKASIQLCTVACALYAQEYSVAIEAIKFLAFDYQFHNEPLRILLTLANSMGIASLAVFSQPNNLKTFLRRSRIHEVIVQGGKCEFTKKNNGRWVVREALFEGLTAKKMARNAGRGRRASTVMDGDDDNYDDGDVDDQEDGASEQGSDEDDDHRHQNIVNPELVGAAQDTWKKIKDDVGISAVRSKPPTKYDPANDMFYASHILTSTNGVPSMGYWIRAFARQQNDPLICLTATIACFGRAQNRQVDNRHQVILQGFAFLDQYRKLRKDQDHHPCEVSYNFARAYHLLGLYQLATPHYLEVLSMHDKEMSSNKTSSSSTTSSQVGFQAWPEAAYNLAQIYLTSGNTILANQVMERYLRV